MPPCTQEHKTPQLLVSPGGREQETCETVRIRKIFTHINDGPLLHYDGVVRWGGYVGLDLAPLLENEDTFHRLRQHICREEEKK